MSCRFFFKAHEFHAEAKLYRDPVLRQVLPELRTASDNANGAVRSRSGFVFPPYLVSERGITLAMRPCELCLYFWL